MRKGFLIFVIFTLTSIFAAAQYFPITQGTLNAFGENGDLGSCPLKHTDVKVEISGFLSRVRVRQEFENNFNQPIEAVYTFPLGQNSAVDDMTMMIGSRVIKGKILKREEARQVYEAAKSQGQTAALLDQQRTNIFTQSVANILPGEKIVIEISYVETLKYEDGVYEFVFPMTVGPRYIPGNATGKTGGGFAPDTDKVPDASLITPNVAPTRAGHDISVEVNLDAGVPVESVLSKSHEIQTTNLSSNSALIKLADGETIPNKDFILRYDVTGKRIEDAILAHRDGRGGFFTMILSPPENFRVEDVAPKEIVFVLDTSGSMSGFPIEKANQAMKMSLEGLYPRDTFNLITFAGDTHVLFEKPVPATRDNLNKAQEFLKSRQGSGGTEMMKAIKAALEPSDSNEHIRIVCFMTDGFVGNEAGILAEVQKHPNARVFSFGIGSSVNRMLLDGLAKEGNGEVEYVALNDDGDKAAKKFYERVRTPLLTDISIDWNGLPVADIYPSRIGDLFSAKPVIVNGRFTNGASGTIKLKGKVGGQVFVREIPVNLPETESRHDVLATLWARKRIDELTSKGYTAAADEKALNAVNDTITNIGLEFRLMTQFTSFVAVEERVVNRGGQPLKIEVPVEIPEGVDRNEVSSVYKKWARNDFAYITTTAESLGLSNRNVGGGGGGSGSGRGTGQGSGIGSGSGSGSGTGQTQNATVDVSSTSIVSRSAELLQPVARPQGGTFSSALIIAPGQRQARAGGGFIIDGAAGSENMFVVDGSEVTKFRSGTLNRNNKTGDDEITSSIANLPRPEIPQKTKWAKKDSLVNVDFSVNETGDVTEAKAVSGIELLKKPSENAALLAKFSPPVFEGEALKMSGTISYNYVDSKTVEISLNKMKIELSDSVKRRLSQRQKLHFWLYDLVDRLDKKTETASANESKFVFDGKAEIQINLTKNAPDIIAKLKNAGFEFEGSSDLKVVGRIEIGKLGDLALIEEVRYVSP